MNACKVSHKILGLLVEIFEYGKDSLTLFTNLLANRIFIWIKMQLQI